MVTDTANSSARGEQESALPQALHASLVWPSAALARGNEPPRSIACVSAERAFTL